MFAYPPFFFCKSTGDATREKCNKTNSCSQRCARLCTGAICLLAAHLLSFHLSVIPPLVLSFALYIHLSLGIFFSFLVFFSPSSFFFSRAWLHTPVVVIKFLSQMRQKGKVCLFVFVVVVCLFVFVLLLFWGVFDYWCDVETRCSSETWAPESKGGDVWALSVHSELDLRKIERKMKSKKDLQGPHLYFSARKKESHHSKCIWAFR